MGFLLRLLTCTVVLLAAFLLAESRRSGSSSSSSYRGTSTSRSSYRGSSTSSYRSYRSYRASAYRSSNLRTWTWNKKLVALRAGTIVYSRRRYRFDETVTDGDELFEESMCKNTEKYPQYNESFTSYGWFLCPMEENEANEKYCCGEENKQRCCASNKLSGGAIAGIFIAVCVVFLIVFVVLVTQQPKISRCCRQRQTAY